MRLKPTSAVSVLALFAGATMAMAQTSGQAQQPGATQQERPQRQDQQSGPSRQSDTQGGEQRGQAQQKEQTQPGQRRGQAQEQGNQAEPGQRRGQAEQEQRERGQQKAQSKEQRERGQAEQEQRERGQQKAQSKEQRERGQAQQEQRERGQQKAQSKEQRESGQQKQEAQTKEQRDQARQKQEAETKQGQGQRGTEQTQSGQQQGEQAGRVQLSEQQRTTVRERIRQAGVIDRARVENVNFNVTVGARVPRDRVRLVPLPAVVIEEVPEWRGYSFFVVRDRMVIVQPDTYVIVSVVELDHGPARAARGGHERLTLTQDQRLLVVHSVEIRPGVRLGIGDVTVGMEVPRNVELHVFPQRVVQQIPDLRPYRYFVFEQEVAIVDPQARQVVLLIQE